MALFMLVFLLMFAYGLCFGFQNKLPFLYSAAYRESGTPSRFLDKLLHCTYCLGFHCGWMTWLAAWGLLGAPWTVGAATIPGYVLTALGWSFVCAGGCYLLDALAQKLERG